MMPLRERFAFSTTLVVACLTSVFSQTYVNPGLKLGYTFGSGGGFTYGFELTITSTTQDIKFFIGPVLDIDFCKDRMKVHVGVQGSYFGGLDIGPTWISEPSNSNWGCTATVFGGAFAFAYYSFTFRTADPYLHEIGGYFKYHQYVGQGGFMFNN